MLSIQTHMAHAYHSSVGLWGVRKNNGLCAFYECVTHILMCHFCVRMANFTLFYTWNFLWCVRRIRRIMINSWQLWKESWVPPSEYTFWGLCGRLQNRVGMMGKAHSGSWGDCREVNRQGFKGKFNAAEELGSGRRWASGWCSNWDGAKDLESVTV